MSVTGGSIKFELDCFLNLVWKVFLGPWAIRGKSISVNKLYSFPVGALLTPLSPFEPLASNGVAVEKVVFHVKISVGDFI